MQMRRLPEERRAEAPDELLRMVDYLNALLALDQVVVSKIIDYRMVCSPALSNSQAVIAEDVIGQLTLSPLGILGGFVNRGRFRLTGYWEEEKGVFTEFYVGEYLSG